MVRSYLQNMDSLTHPSLGTLGFGFDQAANNAIVLPSFLAVFGEFDATTQSYAIPSLWLSLWTAMGQAGQFFGALGAGLLQDRLGHRIVFVGFAVLSVVGIAVQYISTTRGVLLAGASLLFRAIVSIRAHSLAGKILNGGSIGAFYTLATSYISEIAPVRLRGPLVSCANVVSIDMT
jgi:MFS family permease